MVTEFTKCIDAYRAVGDRKCMEQIFEKNNDYEI